MAKVIEDTIVIKLSKLVKNDAVDKTTMVTDEILTTLETVAAELVGEGFVVEATYNKK